MKVGLTQLFLSLDLNFLSHRLNLILGRLFQALAARIIFLAILDLQLNEFDTLLLKPLIELVLNL